MQQLELVFDPRKRAATSGDSLRPAGLHNELASRRRVQIERRCRDSAHTCADGRPPTQTRVKSVAPFWNVARFAGGSVLSNAWVVDGRGWRMFGPITQAGQMKKFVYTIRHVLANPVLFLQCSLVWISTRVSDWELYSGINVAAIVGPGMDESFCRLRIGQALDLIDRHDQGQMTVLLRHTPRILCAPTGRERRNAGYVPWLNLTLVDPTWATDPRRSVAEIAIALVYEAVFARLTGMRIRWWRYPRGRLQRIAVRQQIRLLRKVPDADAELEGMLRIWNRIQAT